MAAGTFVPPLWGCVNLRGWTVPDELREIEHQVRGLNETMIRHLSEFGEWRKTVDGFMADVKDQKTRAPVLLFSLITAVLGTATIAVQIWLGTRP